LFVVLFIITLPFPYTFLPDIGSYFSPYTEAIIKWTGDRVMAIKTPYTARIISDSTGMYLLAGILLTVSIVLGLLWANYNKTEDTQNRLRYWFHTGISYYLALQLAKYGFDKIFKYQFYLPEPNIVYTPLGYLSKDILYWSTVGSSYSYSVFCGVLEIIPAALLLFKPTRMIGAMGATIVMIHVVMLNFSFDISVKVYSCFLLLLSFILAFPGIKRMVLLFAINKYTDAYNWQPTYNSSKKLLSYSFIKSLVIGGILLESLVGYFNTGYFNDDKAPRPFLHGAYDVQLFIRDNDTIPPLLTDFFRFKKIFVHRKGYFITQYMHDEMDDFELTCDTVNKQLLLSAHDHSKIIFDYEVEKDSLLILKGKINDQLIKIHAKKMNLARLPLFQDEFHWTIDDY
jgi:hypothetical protein